MIGDDRPRFSSGWAAVLATAGVAVGLGNIWRFPYMMGMFGGAAFLTLYVAIVVLFGIPALMAEWALGRATGRGPLGAYRTAGLRAGTAAGVLLFVTVMMATPYYAVVLGWVVYSAAAFAFQGTSDFQVLASRVDLQLPATAAVLLLAAAGVYFGVRGGIERASRAALPLFFGLFVVLALRTLTLDGAGEGLSYYLVPRWSQLSGGTLLAAMGQACFSLGLGGTFMVLYGSYLPTDIDLRRTAVWTAAADAGAAFLAGLVVVPAVIATGLELASGPPLMFEVMPRVFASLPAPSFFGALFFLSILLVGTLSLMASLEVLLVGAERALGWSRKRCLPPVLAIQLALAVPSMWSLNYLFYSDLVWGTTMQPAGSVFALLALTWSLGRSRTLKELNLDSGLLYLWLKYVIPTGITATLVYGWSSS